MTASEWQDCSDSKLMLKSLRQDASNRKLRLFACACCRSVWHFIADNRNQITLLLAERKAEGKATPGVPTIRGSTKDCVAWSTLIDSAWEAAWHAAEDGASENARQVVRSRRWERREKRNEAWNEANAKERFKQAALLRDIFGNPFRPLTLDPSWLTPTVLSLAQAAYNERALPGGTLDHERLMVLSDALEDAGCDDAQILTHLRGPGPHVRGCFALDLVLEKQ